jgi:5S rRNA maturation endonuclease (ribonuclease M5)
MTLGATSTAYERLLDRLRDGGKTVRNTGPNKAVAQCPAHEDRSPSLSVTQIEGQALIHCHAGCQTEDVLAALNLSKRDLFDDSNGATYEYPDGRQVRRTYNANGSKRFYQSGNTNGQKTTLYRLTRVQAAISEGRTVWLVEGEKDVHAIESLGEVATTAPQGAGNVDKCDLSPLHGAQIIAIPDRDEAGLKWAQQVQRLLDGKAGSLDFAIAQSGKDAADHIAAGHTLEELLPTTLPLAMESEDVGEDLRFIPGGNFILDTDPIPTPLWGDGEEVLWADGEALIIAGPQGAGKTTLGQQVSLGWIGLKQYAELLGFPVRSGTRLLYLAMDRPRQAARSFRRMVDEVDRDELNDRLTVWKGPPPADLAKYPKLLLDLCEQARADCVVIDSLKDAAIGLSDDEVGAGYNRARQLVCAAGIQILELHHIRKALGGTKAEHPAIDDIYGSTWITSGAGSVILLNGKPGDPIVSLHHLKQPAVEVGPYKILHDDITGRSTIWHGTDLLEVVRSARQMSALDAAKILFDTDKPTDAEKQKARRKLDRLVASGHLWMFDKGDAATKRPALWAVK